MSNARIDEPTRQKPLRLWPGVVAVVMQWLIWVGLPIIVPGTIAGYIAAFGGLIGGLVVVIWWMLFSRAPWLDRLGAIVVMAMALFATSHILHESVATAGRGKLFFFYTIPVLSLGLVLGAVASRRLSDGPRRATMAAVILLAGAAWSLVRIDGVSGTGADFALRWSKTAEERLLAQADEPKALLQAVAGMETGRSVPEWPGFRGPGRDGNIPGVRIATDWSASPPAELWRRPVGPGWSSFAVHGDLIYTQEQRGDDEVVACYSATTGEPVWRHGDTARFWEANAGAGPRGTPTLANGRVYTFGATGILNVLDAGNGAVVWSRNVATEKGAKVPYWGFSSSPLVVDDVVIVAIAGDLAAYDVASGDPRWSGPDRGNGYSSPHFLTIDGVAQVLLMSGTGATSVAPADGTLLWEHEWSGYPIVQPARIADGDLLISASEGSGVRRLAVAQGSGGWTLEERWTSTRLKPYFNDFVVHAGHAFGFDGNILACLDVEDGQRKWKGGRYGQGQLVLLPDQDVLLVMSERGELALVAANPEKFAELARFPAIEGKTWNHPVLVDDLLLVRNSEEMAAFRLPLANI